MLLSIAIRSKHSLRLKGRQYPIRLCSATTIRSQGETLERLISASVNASSAVASFMLHYERKEAKKEWRSNQELLVWKYCLSGRFGKNERGRRNQCRSNNNSGTTQHSIELWKHSKEKINTAHFLFLFALQMLIDTNCYYQSFLLAGV